MRVTLNRIFRLPPAYLFVSLSSSEHVEKLTLFLQQPAYGTSYIMGKIDVERLIAERARQQGDAFQMQAFMEEFNAAGLIPASLVRWQLTKNAPDVIKMLSEK